MISNKFQCNNSRIEIIINYFCNLRCYNCDALVSQAPTSEVMSINQISKFIQESIGNEKKWEIIRILGGEPTLHNRIFEILELLLSYKKKYSINTRIVLVTNGHGKIVRSVLDKIPTEIEIENSSKETSEQAHFSPVTAAPCDMKCHKRFNYTRGCWIPSICGIALDIHGYYSCSFAAAADRAIGLDVGEKSLKKIGTLHKHFEVFCQYCGHFCDKINDIITKKCSDLSNINEIEKIQKMSFHDSLSNNNYKDHVFSKSWKKILNTYNNSKPLMSKY